jgi:hypothetical protein
MGSLRLDSTIQRSTSKSGVVNDRLCVRLTREDANRSLAKSVIVYDITARIRLSQPASAAHDVGFAVSMAGAVAVMRE